MFCNPLIYCPILNYGWTKEYDSIHCTKVQLACKTIGMHIFRSLRTKWLLLLMGSLRRQTRNLNVVLFWIGWEMRHSLSITIYWSVANDKKDPKKTFGWILGIFQAWTECLPVMVHYWIIVFICMLTTKNVIKQFGVWHLRVSSGNKN